MLMREAFRRWWESTPPSHLEGVLILSYEIPAASFHLEASPSSSLQAVAEIPCRNFIFFPWTVSVFWIFTCKTLRGGDQQMFLWLHWSKRTLPGHSCRRSYMDKPLLTVSSSKILHGVFLQQWLVLQVIDLSTCTYFHRSLLISISFAIPPLNG